MKVILGY
ncbi:hypothetical protein YPPY96_1663, partial [Yersinia pestis PY-96]